MSGAEIAGVALGIAGCGIGLASLLISTKRHRRLRRRLSRVERRERRLRSELLPLLRTLWARSLSGEPSSGGLPISPRGETGEDLVLLALLSAGPGGAIGDLPRSGYYIEAGGFDGRLNSPTYIFEALGWDGLLVEPIEALAEQARAARPRSRVVHAALGRRGASGTVSLRVYDPEHADAAGRTDLASHVEGADAGTSRPARESGRSVSVPLTTLGDLLDDPERGHPGAIDVLVLDVEGAEMDALDGLDLSRRRPRFLVLEDHTHGPEQPEALVPHGYVELCRLDFNRIYAHESEHEAIALARDVLALDQVGIA